MAGCNHDETVDAPDARCGGVRTDGITRRAWLRASAAAALIVGAGLSTKAAAAPALGVAVPTRCVGAIVAAVGGRAVNVRVDARLSPTKIRIGKDEHTITERILLKGAKASRARYLDDARNAPKLGANIRDALAKADPSRKALFEKQHKAWSRPFARKVLGWQSKLAKSVVRGKRVRDVHGRIYLLSWSGARVDAKAKWAGPPALASLPREPASATLAAYEAYVERLVAAVR